jgi:hypothetical protein
MIDSPTCLDTSAFSARAVHSRPLNGTWEQLGAAVREYWPRLTEQDLATLVGERDELMRILKVRYNKTYGEIEREVTEFELRDARSAYASRSSRGITND